MLIVLLIIIAVGVLLISPDGRDLLSVLRNLALITGAGYVIFWVCIFCWAMITTHKVGLINAAEYVFYIFMAGYLCFLVYSVMHRWWKASKLWPILSYVAIISGGTIILGFLLSLLTHVFWPSVFIILFSSVLVFAVVLVKSKHLALSIKNSLK